MSVDFNEVADYYDAMYVDPAGYENECDQVVEFCKNTVKQAVGRCWTSPAEPASRLDIFCGVFKSSAWT